MGFEVRAELDRGNSVDPSYIVRYQVFEDGRFIGDGVAQYHRLAEHNDVAVPGTIRRLNGDPLPAGVIEAVKKKVAAVAAEGVAGSGA
ncbi:MAG: hypothetical protein K6T80_06045 [Firmicutes bacterium]|nr:hypothetical protein [Bacillota bacterium]